jgi:hypothetical protein
MATRDFARTAEKKDFHPDLFYDPDSKKIVRSHQASSPKAIRLAGSFEDRTDAIIISYQVAPSARKINKNDFIIPPDELAGLVKAITKYDPREGAHRVILKETNVSGRGYYISLEGPGTETSLRAMRVALNSENIDAAIRLIKKGDSIRELIHQHQRDSKPSGTDGPA